MKPIWPAQKTQCWDVLNHCHKNRGITDRDADRHYGIRRLAARIYDLENKFGWTFKRYPVKFTTRHDRSGECTEYRLKTAEQGELF